MQLKSIVFLAFTLFGEIVWDCSYIHFFNLNPKTLAIEIELIIRLHGEFPIQSLIVNLNKHEITETCKSKKCFLFYVFYQY